MKRAGLSLYDLKQKAAQARAIAATLVAFADAYDAVYPGLEVAEPVMQQLE